MPAGRRVGGEGVWIFGYGSLVWRPAFAHRQRRPARIRGFRRRFWQGSTDHRGTPGAPGRVVTLVRERLAECWGVAYEVAASDVDEVMAGLDHREKGGYERAAVDLHFPDRGAREEGILYLATPGNPEYLGPASLAEMARQVIRSQGPSGHNVEYVLRLAEALRAMRPELTPHCDEALALEDQVQRLLSDRDDP